MINKQNQVVKQGPQESRENFVASREQTCKKMTKDTLWGYKMMKTLNCSERGKVKDDWINHNRKLYFDDS